jgi:hypothetical protein
MKKTFTIFLFILSMNLLSQQTYCDFDGIKFISLAEWNGVMDSAHVNPMPDATNNSSLCAKYIRDTALYDNFKFFPYSKLTDVTPYASAGASQKISMKIFTSSAPGTYILMQLGTRTNTTYPAGVHSTYTAVTTMQNAWETVTFNFDMMPVGSTTSATDIDKIVIFFRPNSHMRDTIYFDDPSGPAQTVIGLKEIAANTFETLRNEPNPANGSSVIKFSLSQPGQVSLTIHDVLGKIVAPVKTNTFNAGEQSIFIDTSNYPEGIYFCTLDVGDTKKTLKMVVDH